MATAAECRAALERLAERMAAGAAHTRTRLDLDRTLACRIPDLGVAYHGHLRNGHIVDLTDGDNPRAKLRLTANSDDLIALVDGRLHLANAWSTGRVKVDASVLDLVKLRKLL